MKSLWAGSGLVLIAAALGLSAPAAPISMEHVVLHRDDTMFYLGPSLVLMPDGEILLGLREAHAHPPESQAHLDPSSRAVLLRSHDGGRTFGEKTVISDETHRFSATQDTVITRLADGSLLAAFYSWGISPVPAGIAMEKLHSGRNVVSAGVYGGQRINFDYIGISEGLWTSLSTDRGRHWSPRRAVDIPGLPPLVGRTQAMELPDGTLMLVEQDLEGTSVINTAGYARVFCIRSRDHGTTWGDPTLIGDGAADHLQLYEPSLIRLRSGRLITMCRTDHSENPAGGHLFESISDDDGRTWSKPRQTPMWGFPAHILELRDGRLLCSYGYRRAPYGVRAVLSSDRGETWDFAHELIVRDDGGSSDLGYPVSIQLADGTVLMAYYFNQQKPGDLDSKTRYIAGTFLKL